MEANWRVNDVASLQVHPLAQRLVPSDPHGADVPTGRQLRQLLLDAVAQLEPDSDAPNDGAGMRHYRLLSLRYVQGRSVVQAHMELGISQSEYYREHGRVLEGLTAIIAARLTAPPGAPIAHAVASDLSVVDPAPPTAPAPTEIEDGTTARPFREVTPLVGHGQEMARLRQLYDAVAAGERGYALMIRGRAGEGKTRLTRELARHVAQNGGRFLLGRYERDDVIPYAVWADLLRSALAPLTPDALRQLVGPQASEIVWFCPELAGRLGADRAAGVCAGAGQ
ncbi:MAG: AAA family ATPase [Chloroflexi bacterium]|nr:AAA family ATPase [Chloroflexota bacterium]